MKRVTNALMTAAVAALMLLGCSGDLNRNSSPVELVVTNSQTLNQVDLEPGAANCNQSIGTISIQAIVKRTDTADPRFNDVRITRYRVSYVRTDGGHAVPSSFVRSIDFLVTANGGSQNLSNFLAFEADAFNLAPFAALQPINGSRDPETGKSFIKMDIVLEVFGQTIAGENVSGSTRLPVDFCYHCPTPGCF